jgi:hypothetical protein
MENPRTNLKVGPYKGKRNAGGWRKERAWDILDVKKL